MMRMDSDYSSNGLWAGMRPRLTALVGLGPGLRQRGWGHGLYHWVEVQGSSRPRDHYAVQ